MSHHFWCHKYHKIVNNFINEQDKKIFVAKTLRIIVPVLFTQKFVIKLSKIPYGFGIQDPGSRRVKKAPDPESATLAPRIMTCPTVR